MPRDLTCEGWVVHRRHGAVRHEFRYPVWMLCADVERLDALPSRWMSSRSRLAPLSVRSADFPRDRSNARRPQDSTFDVVSARLRERGAAAPERIFLLTQPRSWGWLFNPVSFYFCYRDGALCNVVAEITNTPWDEVHSYVLDVKASKDGDEEVLFAFPKQFHVSPFMPMDIDYRWRLCVRDDRIEVAMHLLSDGQETFFAGLYLQAEAVSAHGLRRGALVYPLQNLRTLARIYWQAFRLWRKGAPFHAHPGPIEEVRSP